MAYCTPEDTEYLLSQGFALSSDGQAFWRLRYGWQQQIHPLWADMKPGSTSTPPSEDVFWGSFACKVLAGSIPVEHVVQLSDRQPTPTSCFVTAEIRGWRREK